VDVPVNGSDSRCCACLGVWSTGSWDDAARYGDSNAERVVEIPLNGNGFGLSCTCGVDSRFRKMLDGDARASRAFSLLSFKMPDLAVARFENGEYDSLLMERPSNRRGSGLHS